MVGKCECELEVTDNIEKGSVRICATIDDTTGEGTALIFSWDVQNCYREQAENDLAKFIAAGLERQVTKLCQTAMAR